MQLSFPLNKELCDQLRKEGGRFKNIIDHPGNRFALSCFLLDVEQDLPTIANGAFILWMAVGAVKQFVVIDARMRHAAEWGDKFSKYWNAHSEEEYNAAHKEMMEYANEVQALLHKEVLFVDTRDPKSWIKPDKGNN